jgi:hypothetical protein
MRPLSNQANSNTMSSSSENNNRDIANRSRNEELELKKTKKEMELVIKELKLVKEFNTVIRSGLKEVQRLDLGKEANGDKIFQLEDEDRNILYDSNFGFVPAAAAGLATLVVLRNVRPGMLRRFQRPKQPPTNTGTPPHVTNSPFQQGPPPGGRGSYKQKQPSLFSPLFGWSMDLASSFLVATGASIMFTDHEARAKKITTLPLLSGRGWVSEELCFPVLDYLNEIREDESTRKVLEGATTTHLKNLLTFCQNCQRRAAYENRLRQEKGLSSDSPVSIPPPGVPADDNGDSDTSLLAGWNDAGSNQNASGGFASGDFYDLSQEHSKGNEYGNRTDNQEWADSMVSDREQDDSRRP